MDLESMHLTVGVSGNGKQIFWKMGKDGKTCGAGQVPYPLNLLDRDQKTEWGGGGVERLSVYVLLDAAWVPALSPISNLLKASGANL